MAIKARMVALACVAVLPAACDASFARARYQEPVHVRVSKTFPSLTVDDAVGQVNVIAWNKTYVQIDAVKRAQSRDVVRSIKISVEPNGSTLAVTADFQANNVSNRSVDFTIHTPAATNVSVNTSVGRIRISGCTADVEAKSSTGEINVAMARLAGRQRVTLEASVGSVDLLIPRNASASLEAQTSVGPIGGDVPLAITARTPGATARGTIGAGAAKVAMHVSTGSVNVDRE
jgi:DUF4097 and DUF4098 domain-containing protein YvlB